MLNYPFSILLVYQSHRSLVCRAYQARIGLQCLGYLTVAGDGLHETHRQFGIGQFHVNGAIRDVYLDDVAVQQLADIASGCRFGRNVADA